VVSSAKCLGLNSFAELTTPAAPISEGINILDASSTQNHRLAIANPQFAAITLQ